MFDHNYKAGLSITVCPKYAFFLSISLRIMMRTSGGMNRSQKRRENPKKRQILYKMQTRERCWAGRGGVWEYWDLDKLTVLSNR